MILCNISIYTFSRAIWIYLYRLLQKVFKYKLPMSYQMRLSNDKQIYLTWCCHRCGRAASHKWFWIDIFIVAIFNSCVPIENSILQTFYLTCNIISLWSNLLEYIRTVSLNLHKTHLEMVHITVFSYNILVWPKHVMENSFLLPCRHKMSWNNF